MPSDAFRGWRTIRRAALDTVETAHTTIHGTGAGRQEATRQINHGYAVLLAAEFQGYCRELHTEAVRHFVANLPTAQRVIVSESFTYNRQLDRGNANSGSIGSDFGRLGLDWWPAFDRIDTAGADLRRQLSQLNEWRNAISHNDFDPGALGGTIRLMLAMVREWRRACNQLARVFDRILADHLVSVTGQRPW
jgi:hypothetical protein